MKTSFKGQYSFILLQDRFRFCQGAMNFDETLAPDSHRISPERIWQRSTRLKIPMMNMVSYIIHTDPVGIIKVEAQQNVLFLVKSRCGLSCLLLALFVDVTPPIPPPSLRKFM
jgi:hypothetical protein